jgi:hypothetical protein
MIKKDKDGSYSVLTKDGKVIKSGMTEKDAKSMLASIDKKESLKENVLSFSESYEAEFEEADASNPLVRKCSVCAAGITKNGAREYPAEVLKRDAKAYEGARMFLNHQTANEADQRPERSVEDDVAEVKKSWYDESKKKIMAEFVIYGSPKYTPEAVAGWIDAKKKAGSPVELSHHGYLEAEPEQRESKTVSVIKRLNKIVSVDFVTHGNVTGAQVESLRELEEGQKLYKYIKTSMKKESLKEGGGIMTWEEFMAMLTCEAIRKDRPDLAEEMTKETSESLKKEQDANKLLKETMEADKLKTHKAGIMAEVEKVISESKLPEKAIAKIKETAGKLEIKLDATVESVKAEVVKIIASEKAYIESIAGPEIFGNGGNGLDGKEAGQVVNESLAGIFAKPAKK